METYARPSLFIYSWLAMEKLIQNIIWLCTGVFLLIACEKEPVETVFEELGNRNGVFISCEGNFMYGNASLSFYDKEEKEVFNQVFYARNRAPLGDVAHSVTKYGNQVYIVLNNSGKIVVADPRSLEYKGAIKGLVSPRYVHFISDSKAYVSDLYGGRITIFNPATLSVTGTIQLPDGKPQSAGHPTETFVETMGKVFVTCWAYDEYVMIIDPVSDTVIDSVKVPYQPKKMVKDANGKLWVLTDGNFNNLAGNAEKPAIVKIDPATHTVEMILRWDIHKAYAGDLRTNPAGDTLYIMAGDIFKMSVQARKLPIEPWIRSGNRRFFSMGVDPLNGEVYVSDALDYMQNAMVYRHTYGGNVIDSFRVGVNPGDYYFNNH